MCLKGRSSEEESKARVAAIHDLKEKLKSENEELKKIKHKLKDVQEKQKGEKEVNLWKIRAPIRHMFGTSCKLLPCFGRDPIAIYWFSLQEAKSQTTYLKGNAELRYRIEVCLGN